ncbi:MAG: hypothetical protein HY647_07555, partial [Acidobacteria bacterium]|nr:hypothetical protein [Acidobacteriota bacterium]
VAVNAAPPDTNLSVGDTQAIQWVNLSFAVFDKSGNVQWGPVPGKTLWAGMPVSDTNSNPHPCAKNNDGDPIILFDEAAQRWVGLQLSYTGGPPYYVCFAVSSGPDAVNSTWCRYALNSGSNFPDYPKLGVWPDGYYITYNQFQGQFFVGPAACAIDRASILAGSSNVARNH